MIPLKSWKILWTATVLLSLTLSECRRVRVKTIAATSEEPVTAAAQGQPPRQVLFYAEEPQERSEEEAPQVIIARPSFNRASGGSGGQHHQHLASRARQETAPKTPPVQTIRNYNKINDDGSFTFGYEAADGSFKEETRGTDCVVRGKYGYVDPDGNKREFTYVSGNPCDPNSISQEEEDELKDKSNEDENIPANIPRRPNFASRPLAVAKARPTTTYFQQSFNNDNSLQDDDNNQLVEIRQPARPIIRPGAREDEQLIRTTARPLTRVTIPASTRFATAAATRQTSIENQPATTYRPQIVQIAVTPSPSSILPKTTRGQFVTVPSSSAAPPSAFFDEQFKKFQLDGNSGAPSQQATLPKGLSSNPVYSTELVYDPASGQYNTIVYQQVPKFGGEISLNQRLPSFVPSPQVPPPQPSGAPARFLVSSTTPAPTPQPFFQQQIIEQQRQAALVQQSQQLYNQQLRQQQLQQQRQFVTVTPPPQQNFAQTTLLKQNPHRFPQPIVQRFPPEPKQFGNQEAASAQFQQPFFYLNPSVPDQRQNLAAGQIEAFLRGHNLQF